jgi:tetratricopeptide (TPR) repeat protein
VGAAQERTAPGDEGRKPAPPAAEAAGDDLASPTLAELYLKQGETARALEMYEQLLARDPGNRGLVARVAEVRGLGARPGAPMATEAAGRAGQVRRAVARLERLLAAVRAAARASGVRG